MGAATAWPSCWPPRVFSPTTLPRSRMTAVTQLGWLRNGEYAPIMIADAKGYFKEEGIDHKIVDGGPGKNPIPIVAVGPSAVRPGDQWHVHRTARALPRIRSTSWRSARLFQQAPTSYSASHEPDAPQPKPRDMEGKTVGVQAGTEFVFHAFARRTASMYRRSSSSPHRRRSSR